MNLLLAAAAYTACAAYELADRVREVVRREVSRKRDADLCAVMDATRESVPSAPTGDDLIYHRIVAEIVEQSADERTCLYGDADFDEWAVEMHPSNWGGEDE